MQARYAASDPVLKDAQLKEEQKTSNLEKLVKHFKINLYSHVTSIKINLQTIYVKVVLFNPMIPVRSLIEYKGHLPKTTR